MELRTSIRLSVSVIELFLRTEREGIKESRSGVVRRVAGGESLEERNSSRDERSWSEYARVQGLSKDIRDVTRE